MDMRNEIHVENLIYLSFRKTSKTRQGRANRQQIEALVSHLEQHPYMATGKFNSMNANENVQEKLQKPIIRIFKFFNYRWKEKRCKILENCKYIYINFLYFMFNF